VKKQHATGAFCVFFDVSNRCPLNRIRLRVERRFETFRFERLGAPIHRSRRSIKHFEVSSSARFSSELVSARVLA